MSQQNRFKPRKKRANPMATHRLSAAFDASLATAAAADFPGLELRDPEDSRRTWITGGMAAALHLGVLGFLVLLASLAPQLVEEIIPVQLIKEEPPPSEELQSTQSGLPRLSSASSASIVPSPSRSPRPSRPSGTPSPSVSGFSGSV